MNQVPVLVVFARAPERDRVKTRLACDLGPEAALAIYEHLLIRTASVVSTWKGPTRILYAGCEAALADSALGAFPRQPQIEGNLGERLSAAATELLPAHPAGLLFIGTDCPLLASRHLTDLAAALDRAQVAIGPASDGGYWGIGLRHRAASRVCFARDLPWSQSGLLAATRDRLTVAGVTLATTTLLDDLDDLADLRRAEAAGFRWQAKHGSSDHV